MSTLNLGDSLILNSDITEDTEIKTGATFKGKPVYCTMKKCLWNSTAGQDKATAHNISNIREIIKIDGNTDTSLPMFYPLNFCGSGGVYGLCIANRTNIYLNTNYTGLLGRSAYVKLFYTKNND